MFLRYSGALVMLLYKHWSMVSHYCIPLVEVVLFYFRGYDARIVENDCKMYYSGIEKMVECGMLQLSSNMFIPDFVW